MKRNTSDHTIKNYLDYLEEAYLFLNTQKYYSMDIGLRNAKLNFRQQEKSHLMENVIFVELIRRGYSVDVGVIPFLLEEAGRII